METYVNARISETKVEGGDDLIADFNSIVESVETVGITESETVEISEDCEPTKINYIAEFYKSDSHDYGAFFSGVTLDTEKLEDLNKEVKRYQKKIEEAEAKIKEVYSKQYRKNYTPASAMMILNYQDRNYVKHYYSVPSGQSVDISMFEENEYMLYELSYKTGEIEILGGYAYDLGGFVTKKYKYTVSGDNKTCKLSLVSENFIGFLENVFADSISKVAHSGTRITRNLNKMNPTEFLNNLYGVNITTNKDLGSIISCKANNAAFETIIKTAPVEIMDQLLSEKFKENKPVNELIGITKNTYKDALKDGILPQVFELADLMQPDKDKYYHKTEADWLGLIKKAKDYESDLDFYGINYGSGSYYGGGSNRGRRNSALLRMLAEYYELYPVLRDNYSFPKYMDYAVKGTVDQGYSGLANFLTELKDYLKMCQDGGYKPTLYSSYLKQTHDLAARNHKISVSPESEAIFQDRYSGFTAFTTKDKSFIILPPTCTDDLKKEGDALNHCVSAYLKRVIDGDCKILFLRKKSDESLITLELRGNQIIQARGNHNRNPQEEEIKALQEFCEARDYELNY